MRHVTNFSSIIIPRRSIVLCDIDDTVLHFGEVTTNYFSTVLREQDPFYEEWGRRIQNQIPELTCISFNDFYSKIIESESELIFVTARNSKFTDMTLVHLKYLGLDKHTVYHLNGSCKGDFVNNMNLDKDRPKLFIDDSLLNTVAVKEKNPHIETYVFKMDSK